MSIESELTEEIIKKFGQHSMRGIIFKWKQFWMNQRQNNDEDFNNYRSRAIGIDANMQDSLARMISERILPVIVELLANRMVLILALKSLDKEWSDPSKKGGINIDELNSNLRKSAENLWK